MLPRLTGLSCLALSMLLAAGCQRARPYGIRPDAPPQSASGQASSKEVAVEPAGKPAPLSFDLQWQLSSGRTPATPIELVHAEKAPEQWNKLERMWNDPSMARPIAVLGLSPLAASSVLAGPGGAVRIRVPLGLPDPSEYIPAGNPLTLEKWQLGRQLFFDPGYLVEGKKVSCASCHYPAEGFAGRGAHGFNTPSLVNCVFSSYQFWDGRATRLEEVVQRTLEDERPAAGDEPFHHVWHGVITRLRDNLAYTEKFQKVFGCEPTQDTVGRAIATYLRTLLAGNSLYDRAVAAQQKRHAPTLEAADFAAVLKDSDLEVLQRPKAGKEQVARELHQGYQLFHDPQRTHCIRCHTGRTFSDGEFHNLGVGFRLPDPDKEPGGRFAHVPIGQKDRHLVEAYKTPTLRGLVRSAPYFHNGQARTLEEVVDFYDKGGDHNDYQDPELSLPSEHVRVLKLKPEEKKALVLFLRSLNGEEVDPIVRTAPTSDR